MKAARFFEFQNVRLLGGRNPGPSLDENLISCRGRSGSVPWFMDLRVFNQGKRGSNYP